MTERNPYWHSWTIRELEYLKEHYANNTRTEIAQALGRTKKAVGRMAVRLGLSKCDMFQRFWDKVLIGDGCWEWTARKDKDGYGQFRLATNQMKLAHRVAWELMRDSIPDGLLVLHRCDNPGCVRLDHLFLGTHQDNMDDKMRKGRYRNGSSKP